jgi:hypothetical protein
MPCQPDSTERVLPVPVFNLHSCWLSPADPVKLVTVLHPTNQESGTKPLHAFGAP